MDPLLLSLIAIGAGWVLRAREQQRRIALLSTHLAGRGIERHIEALAEGYLRALGEQEPQRAASVWALLEGHEQALAREVEQLARSVAGLDALQARVSRLPVWLPGATQWGPAFDLRELLQVHARGIRRAVDVPRGDGAQARDRAYAISAEMLLLQHSCHWYCRSLSIASARVLARHKTPHAQLVAGVTAQTRAEYAALTGVR